MKFIPYEYQTYTIEKIIKNKRFFAVLDMGLG